jgi:hypothetical protein
MPNQPPQLISAKLTLCLQTSTTYLPPIHRQPNLSSAQGRTLPHQLNLPIPTSTMRSILAPLLLAPLALAAESFQPFSPALPVSENNSTLPLDDLLVPRQNQNPNACATGYYACAALAAPGLCCPRSAICTSDQNRAVACCPQGAQCTGALGAAPTSGAFVPASTTTGTPIFQTTGAEGPRSTVQNAFYPFPYIPTTYTNAAACSAAYTSCQSDAASCTTALANGAQGVRVSAPNGGATITAVPSVGLQSAQSICASLSLQACSGLQVEACRSFGGEGNGVATRGCGGLLMGAGVAVGVAGQLLR